MQGSGPEARTARDLTLRLPAATAACDALQGVDDAKGNA